MSYTFRKAIREEVGVLVGLIGCSGSGKTYSAMRLASGMSGDKPFAVIDTENGRALHYADMFRFDHARMNEPFLPDAYAEAIGAAAKAGYRVIVVDSMSHEWAGIGGILEWQEEELTRMAGDDYRKREACKMAAWIKPKMSHKAMIQRLLQVNAHLILCLRAEEKVKMEKDPQGKTQIVPQGFQPICEKNLPYELTVSFLLEPDNPGIGKPIKLQEQHKALFPDGQLLSESAGKGVSAWAKGGAQPTTTPQTAMQLNEAKNLLRQRFGADGRAAGAFIKQAIGDVKLSEASSEQAAAIIAALNKLPSLGATPPMCCVVCAEIVNAEQAAASIQAHGKPMCAGCVP